MKYFLNNIIIQTILHCMLYVLISWNVTHNLHTYNISRISLTSFINRDYQDKLTFNELPSEFLLLTIPLNFNTVAIQLPLACDLLWIPVRTFINSIQPVPCCAVLSLLIRSCCCILFLHLRLTLHQELPVNDDSVFLIDKSLYDSDCMFNISQTSSVYN